MPEKSVTELGRKDHTKELDASLRRLDAFARLLAARSECVAVTIIEDNLYIAANELHPSHKGEEGRNQIYSSMIDIINYFKDLAAEAAKPDEASEVRKKIFCDIICNAGRFKEAANRTLAKKIAEKVMKFHDPSISEILKDHGANFDIASRMYGEFTDLYQDFLKLEEDLQSSGLDKGLKTVFSKLSSDSILAKEEKGTHAEMQLLVEIIEHRQKLAEKDDDNNCIYIGISKLCCLGCRSMLEAANEQFGKNLFLTRGRHDLDFKDNWFPPNKFKPGYDSFMENDTQAKLRSAKAKTSSAQQEQDDYFKIGYRGHEIIHECRSAKAQAKEISTEKADAEPMRASQSDSEPDVMEDHRINQFKQQLEKQVAFMKNLQQHSEAVSVSAIELVQIAVNIHGLPEFNDFSKKIIALSQSNQGSFDIDRMMRVLLQPYRDIYKQELQLPILKTIMQDPMLIGKNIAMAYKVNTQKETQSVLHRFEERFNSESVSSLKDGSASSTSNKHNREDEDNEVPIEGERSPKRDKFNPYPQR